MLIAPVDIPSGATITGVGFNYCDTNATGNYTVTLFDSFGDNNFSVISTFTVTDRVGCGYAFSPAVNYNYDANSGHFISIYVFQPNVTDGTVKFRSAEVTYKRRVSPGPAVATFGDVSTANPIFRFVEALAASGITAGCGGGNYCPDTPVTRGQMAVFLSAALGLHFPN